VPVAGRPGGEERAQDPANPTVVANVLGQNRAAVATVAPPRGRLRAAWLSCRPAEWAKNAFVAAPLVFSGRLDDPGAVVHAALAVAGFSAVASAGYLLNDVRDAPLDRHHPRKRERPVARGELSAKAALGIAGGLAAVGAGAAAAAGPGVLALVVAYAGLSAAYSLWLKTQVILDVLAIAAGFLLRVLAGSAAVGAEPSRWLIVCTGMLAVFLGFAKRRQEVASELHIATASRPVLEHYSLPFLDQMIPVATAGTVLSYVLYAVDSPVIGDRMLPTAAPVLYGVFRYLWLVYHRRDQRDTATLIRSDPGLVAAGATWLALAVVLLYLWP
jgi:4-hydroxybenzoate polyprenyltransferase